MLSKKFGPLGGGGRSARFGAKAPGEDRLSDLTGLKNNPGALKALYYVPPGLPRDAALVVVLHGCTQNAAGYDHGSGWSRLADRHGFALLFPEQIRANNPNLCFNWFTANDSQRGMGEPASIKAMIDAMAERWPIDPKRIFVTGLSAGGAMASVMLATYPEIFAAGAIIAGIPYGCASGVAEAFQCMGGRAEADTAQLARSVRRASPHKGPWPRISVWQGSADRTVVPSNADAIVRQWTAVHGLGLEPTRTEIVSGYPRRVWTDSKGTELVEEYEITGMAHGTPLMPGSHEGESGEAMAHMLDVGLSSTDHIAAFFAIAPHRPAEPNRVMTRHERAPGSGRNAPLPKLGPIQNILENAFKAAGLMR
jgi:poly(hydroxyalkanoate) depolymerase family esterase